MVSFLVCFYLGDISFKSAIALPLGHLLSCFSDTFTKQGVQLFYPDPAWAISVSNPRRRLKTAGAGKLWVLGTAIALLVFGIYLASYGGITTKVSQNLGLRYGVIRIYNENAVTNHVYADIKGVWTSDRRNADGRYWIVGTEGSEFIISNGKGIYKTGEQILTTKVSTSVGDNATTEIKNISFNDENAVEPLVELEDAYSNSVIFVSGQLGIDFPEEVNISIKPKQYITASLASSTLNFRWQSLDEAILLLREQYAVGTIEVRFNHSQNLNETISEFFRRICKRRFCGHEYLM